jgi:FkbM family methyltransferase
MEKAVQSDLIFDVGMHVGEDTEFYLKKGFRVVAIEADPAHAERGARRFAAEIADGRLTLVDKAIARAPGRVSFYRSHHNTSWGTIFETWAARNKALGDKTAERIEVEATTMGAIFEAYGVPYFMKIDVEGADVLCLEALRDSPVKPKYLSIESNKISLSGLRDEFRILRELGYERFKVVPQHLVPRQRPPSPSREGRYVDHSFCIGASGLFGEEAPGRWLDARAAYRAYLPIFLRYRIVGDNPVSRLGKRVAARLGLSDGWYDTHAGLAETTGG